MVDFETQYKQLIREVHLHGFRGEASKGTFKQLIHKSIILEPDTVPLITGRKMYPKGVIGELKGFLNNASSDEDFRAYGCNFWGAWAANGVDYARLLHNFNGVDQLSKIITSLKNHPYSRKHVISLWDPSSTTLQPPCVMHYQWLIQDGKLHMVWSQRSADLMIGLASDMFSAWLFNKLMDIAVGVPQGEVYMQIASAHLYDPEEYLSRPISEHTATLELSFRNIYDWEAEVVNYNPQPHIKFELLA